ncbi:MAG: hypothetical protein IPM98_14970 [Lewinellaceae bacterium]|nr:hypothetical protein [Lewinellaceae bacterium]
MQKQSFFLVAFTLMALAACTKKDANDLVFKLDTPFLLEQGAAIPWDGNSAVQVRFGRVVSDSRCPIDAICVWAGRAEVELTFIQPGSTLTDTLVLGELVGTDKTDTATFGSYTVQLSKVLPDALSGVEISQEDYKVELRVKKQ